MKIKRKIIILITTLCLLCTPLQVFADNYVSIEFYGKNILEELKNENNCNNLENVKKVFEKDIDPLIISFYKNTINLDLNKINNLYDEKILELRNEEINNEYENYKEIFDSFTLFLCKNDIKKAKKSLKPIKKNIHNLDKIEDIYKDYLISNIIKVNENNIDICLENVYEYIYKLPLPLIERLNIEGFKFYAIKDDLTNYPTLKDLKGKEPYEGYGTTWENVTALYHSKENAAFINMSRYIDKRHGSLNPIIHEIGHAIDSSLYRISQTKEFKAITNKEKAEFGKLLAEIFKKSQNFANTKEKLYEEQINEYFAETFDCYFYNEEKLKERCPETHLFMKNIIQSFKRGYGFSEWLEKNS